MIKHANKISVMLFLLSLFIVLTFISSASAASTIYVNTTGNDTAGNGSAENPYLTIGKGINATDENGTVQIADGTYSGDGNTNLTITKNMIITGQNQKKTIINGTGANWIFKVNSSINLTITNLTITNTTALNDGAIYNQGNLTVTNCTFTNNTATGAQYGGAIYNVQDGTLNVRSCTFTNNSAYAGGAIFNWGGTINNMTSCTFTGNKATIAGGAICNVYGTINKIIGCTFTGNAVTGNMYGGGAIYSYRGNISTVSGCTFTDNTVTGDLCGGAIYNDGSTLNVTGSAFTGNSATYGGAIYNGGNLTVNFSRFVNNSATNGNAIYNADHEIRIESVDNSGNSVVNAENNWWGSNTNPKNIPNLIAGDINNVDADPWIVLTINADPTTIHTGSRSNVGANLRYNSNGVDTSSLGTVPDTPITFAVDANGNLNPLSETISSDRLATTIFTATSKGTAIISATADGFTLNQTITIINTPTIPNSNITENTANAASKTTKTIELQKTGLPLNYLILAIFMVISALIPKRK